MQCLRCFYSMKVTVGLLLNKLRTKKNVVIAFYMSDGPGPTLTKIPGSAHVYFCFDLILYIPFNNFSVISGRIFLG